MVNRKVRKEKRSVAATVTVYLEVAKMVNLMFYLFYQSEKKCINSCLPLCCSCSVSGTLISVTLMFLSFLMKEVRVSCL